jgi:hypothetical protein
VGSTLRRRAAGPEPGPLLFARFALPPNRLGYCGGEEAASLLQHIEAGVVDEELRRLARDFEGAYPYLRLIAHDLGVGDPLDRAVVEGYWLGGPALSRVVPANLGRHLEERFRDRVPAREWPWLVGKVDDGALPHHSFHVLELLPRIGLMRGGFPPALVAALEQCLVRPALVTAVEGDLLRVSAARLSLAGGRFRLDGPDGDAPRFRLIGPDGGASRAVTGGARRPVATNGMPGAAPDGVPNGVPDGAAGTELVAWRADGRALLPGPRPGELVALHWGWACQRLSAAPPGHACQRGPRQRHAVGARIPADGRHARCHEDRRDQAPRPCDAERPTPVGM